MMRKLLPLFFAIFLLASGQVQALNSLQQYQIDTDTEFYQGAGQTTTTTTTCGSTSTTPDTGNQTGSEFTLSQVETFASEPVTSTWNISNSTVEQWFLKQASAQPVIALYGLNSSNIGIITSTVEAAKVSPVFFYLITSNEGGTGDDTAADGFINYTSRAGDTGVEAAQADAQQIITDATSSDSPATGGGEPADMPTAEAQNILNSLSSGSIGRYYIPATSAVTAELESLSGKTGDWTGLFNSPLSESMQNIKSMGGDPEQGGATISTAGTDCGTDGVAGQGIEKAINWAIMIANNNGYGYSVTARETGWAKWQSDPSCNSSCGDFDCSSFIAAALTEAEYFQTNPEFVTSTEGAALTGVGFKDITSSVNLTTDAGMQSGDILVNTEDHTAMYIGNNQVVQAADPADGIQVSSYYNYPWTNVYRTPN